MATLTDTHLVLLSHAAQHPEGRLLPLPDRIGKGSGVTRALNTLLRRELIQTEPAGPEDQQWTHSEAGERLTLTITPAGLAALGLSPAMEEVAEETAAMTPAASSPASAAATPDATTDAAAPATSVAEACAASDPVFRPGSKGAAILELLRDSAGATLADMMTLSGWQGHSVRSFLSGNLKKKHGITVVSKTADGVRRYRIAV